MSFVTDIYTVMTGDSSLNGQVTDGIHYENLQSNWLPQLADDETVIVYDFNRSEQGDCMSSKNIYMKYDLMVVVIQKGSNDKIETITRRLITYLNNMTDGRIIDIGFVVDAHGFDQQQNIYTNTLSYSCTYDEE